MSGYFEREHLTLFGKGILGENKPELWQKFLDYYSSSMAEGSIDAKTKKLIALAVAMSIDCPYCIEAYTRESIAAGYTKEELTEVLHIVSSMKAGANLAFGVQMKTLADKIEF